MSYLRPTNKARKTPYEKTAHKGSFYTGVIVLLLILIALLAF